MNTKLSCLVVSVILVASGTGPLAAQSDRPDYISDASFVVGTHEPASREHTPAAMASAAQALLDSLDDEQRAAVNLSLDDRERREWTNLPARPDAGGLRMGLMSDNQVRAVCDLMGTLLSQSGYAKMRDIMLADDQLVSPGRPRPGFGTEWFSVVVFGEPSETEPWSFQLDGHHIGINVSVEGDQLTMSPSFIGTQPEAFDLGERQVRPLAGEIDGAFELVDSLNDDQRRAAVIRPDRGRIVTGPGADGEIPQTAGVAGSDLDDEQQELLVELISQWTGNMPEPHASKRLAEIRDEIDEVHFSWNGAVEPGSDISYRIQGPSVIIEYACQDLGGNPTDHLHTMYRNPQNEYGGQIR